MDRRETDGQGRDRRGRDRLIAEDLLLLLLDDEKGTTRSGTDVATVLGGALLVELALGHAVEVGDKPGWWGKAKVYAVSGAAASAVRDDPILARALTRVEEKERSAEDLVGRLGKGAQEELAERLAADGILERHEGRVLGLFNRTTWPARDVTHEDSVRRQLAASLTGSQPPDLRTSALISLLQAVDLAHKVVPHEGVSGREVRKRAKQISEDLAEGGWATDAVEQAIAAAAAATTAAVMAAVVASTTASAGSN